MTQRAFVVLWGVVALLAVLHNPQGWGRASTAPCAAWRPSLVAR